MADRKSGDADSVYHGGSLTEARSLFPAAPEPMIDLSTGINPHSYPPFDLPGTALTRLPEPDAVRRLSEKAAAAYGAPTADMVVAAPGTQILLPLVAGLVRPGLARILTPTYAGHAPACRLAGHHVEPVDDVEALSGADLAILVNPNNPDGRLLDRADLLRLAETLRKRNGMLVIDEAFMDVGPEGASLADAVGRGGLAVLRSFGKFFGLAGVRLGFAIAEEKQAARLRALLGAWPVPGPALEYGLRALSDRTWRQEMRKRLAREAAHLRRCFARHGVAVIGGTSLFLYVKAERSERLFRCLGEAGLFLRRFPERPGFLRCGLPPDDVTLERLETALERFERERGAPS